MNHQMMAAFCDELEKIADWSLAGPGIHQYSGSQILGGGVPEGAHVGPSIHQKLLESEMLRGEQRRAAEARRLKMEKMLQSGEWNPKTHLVDLEGNLIPKPARVPPSAVTNVGAKPSSAVSKVEKPLSTVAKKVPRLGRWGKVGLGLAALGTTGLAGYEAGKP